jgi:hypothetical protein
MANLPGLKPRQPRIDEAELELTRTRTIERLNALADPGVTAVGATFGPASPPAIEPVPWPTPYKRTVGAVDDGGSADSFEIGPDAVAPGGSTPEAVVTPDVIQLPAWTAPSTPAPSTPVTRKPKSTKAKTATRRATLVPPAAAIVPDPEPVAIPIGPDLWSSTGTDDGAEVETAGLDADVEPRAGGSAAVDLRDVAVGSHEPTPTAITPRPVVIGSRHRFTAAPAVSDLPQAPGLTDPAGEAPALVQAEAPTQGETPAQGEAPALGEPAAEPIEPARERRQAVRTAQVSTTQGRQTAPAAKPRRSLPTAPAFCPYCALFLVPPPESSRPCVRCERLIVVKRVEGHLVFLTEAAIEVFEAERRRSADLERWTSERIQWLRLAIGLDPNAQDVQHLGSAPISEEAVASARNLCLAIVDRRLRDLELEERWEEASDLGHEQAAVMHRLAGSSVRPPDDLIAIHRRAAAADLRWIARVATEAELDGAACCSTCQADDGRTSQIEAELEIPRLPHEGCPKGLCRCQWDLTAGDKVMLRRYLTRRNRPRP